MTFSASLLSMENVSLFTGIAFAVLFIPALSTVILWRRLNQHQKRMGGIILLSLGVEVLTKSLGVRVFNNHIIYHLYMPIQFWLIASVYSGAKVKILSSKTLKRSVVLFFILALLNSLLLQSFREINTHIMTLGSFAFTMFAIMYFYRLLQTSSNERFLKDPILWLSVGHILYYSSLFIFFMPQAVLGIPIEQLTGAMTLTAFFYIIFSLFYTGALWIKQ